MASLRIAVQYGGGRQYYGAAMHLVKIRTVIRVDEALDFQEARSFFWSRWWWNGSSCDVGPRGGMIGPAGGVSIMGL